MAAQLFLGVCTEWWARICSPRPSYFIFTQDNLIWSVAGADGGRPAISGDKASLGYDVEGRPDKFVCEDYEE